MHAIARATKASTVEFLYKVVFIFHLSYLLTNFVSDMMMIFLKKLFRRSL